MKIWHGYLCSLPETSSQRYQPDDHLLYFVREVALVAEVAGSGRCEHVVKQLGIGRRALHRGEMSLQTPWNVVSAARLARHRGYELQTNEQTIAESRLKRLCGGYNYFRLRFGGRSTGVRLLIKGH